MAIGDVTDFTGRLRSVLPGRWFPDSAPVLTAVLTGLATTWASLYAMLAFVRLQARINTATGYALDGAAVDFFGRALVRGSMNDASLRAAILRRLFRQCGTRPGMAAALFAETGIVPTIIEPGMPGDCGVWCARAAAAGDPVLIGFSGSGAGGGGYWGSRMPCLALIRTHSGAASAADIYQTAADVHPAGVGVFVAIQ